MNLKVFATRLRDLRRSHHLTLQSVGEAVGSSPHTIGNLEHGRKSPSLGMVAALADLFGVSVDYFIGRLDEHGEMPSPSPLTPEQKKWLEAIKDLSKKDAEKALFYVAFLRYARQHGDKA